MKNYKISEKDEFIRLLEDLEKSIRIDSEKFQNDPNARDMILRYNALAQSANTYNFSEEERTKVQNLWDSLKNHIKKQNIVAKNERHMNGQELLLNTLREATKNWDKYSTEEKQKQITKINQLQMNRGLIRGMNEQEKEEFEILWNTLKENATIETISPEEYSDITEQILR